MYLAFLIPSSITTSFANTFDNLSPSSILSNEDNTYTGDDLENHFSTSGVLWNSQCANVQHSW